MKKIVLLVTLVQSLAFATNYYVDFIGGSNSAAGTSSTTAWKNLWKVNLASFSPGDYILLKRGSSWNEKLTIPSAGTSGLPITVDAYGSGANPIIDGTGYTLSSGTGLVTINQSYITLNNIEIRKSQLDGVNVTADGFSISGSSIHDNQLNGIATWNASKILMRSSSMYNNSIDTGSSYAGIQINGNATLSSITIENCSVHSNIGGSNVSTWNSGNGITIGNTSANQPTISSLLITGNEIYSNGNTAQNQMGRGITASFTGDITITKNHIYSNASSGVYIGQGGQNISITMSYNEFRNNALRQFGGYTQSSANCYENTIIVDDGSITGMGAEVGGSGAWTLTHNTFLYKAATSDIYRGYITLNDSAQDAVFQGVNNVYYSVSGSPERWRKSNYVTLTFSQWQTAGYDSTSTNPH